MEGWIYVVDNPYYALTGADGKFSITDVPPGTYKLVAIQSFTGPERTIRHCRQRQADDSDDRIEEVMGEFSRAALRLFSADNARLERRRPKQAIH